MGSRRVADHRDRVQRQELSRAPGAFCLRPVAKRKTTGGWPTFLIPAPACLGAASPDEAVASAPPRPDLRLLGVASGVVALHREIANLHRPEELAAPRRRRIAVELDLDR